MNTPRYPDRIDEENEVRQLLADWFRDDDHELWWCTKNPLFGGWTPDQMLKAWPERLLRIVRYTAEENR